MRILSTADLHLGGNLPYSKRDEFGFTTRLNYVYRIFESDIYKRLAKWWDVGIFAGDFFDEVKLGGEALAIAARIIRLIESNNQRWYILKGNHDDDGKVSSLRQYELLGKSFEKIKFITTPKVVPIGRHYFFFLPWDNLDNIRYGLKSFEKDVKRLQRRFHFFILVGHFAVKRTEYYSSICKEGVDKKELHRLIKAGATWIILGHHHKPQQFLKQALYVGSPYQKDFGEINEEHGLWILGTNPVSHAFYKSSAPTFMDVNATGYKRHDYTNKIVRVTFDGDQYGDIYKVRDYVYENGAAYFISKFRRAKREKRKFEIGATWTPEQMLEKYVEEGVSEEFLDRVGKDKAVRFFMQAIENARKGVNHGT